MTTITVEEAQAMLPELIDQLVPGGELLITRNAHAVARLVPADNEPPHPVFGRGRGKAVVVSDDDEYLKGFEEYIP